MWEAAGFTKKKKKLILTNNGKIGTFQEGV
jgi:hypothetical protein